MIEWMNVGLIDIDSHNFPNLVLMKLSAWHKAQGDATFLVKPDDVFMGENIFHPYGRLYGACVFSENAGIARKLEAIGAYVAGSGTGKSDVLPSEVEHIMPDYGLYGITDTAYGFLTRGCPRRCPFCIVSQKEGAQSRKTSDLSEWWAGQKYIKLLDPNLLACPEHESLLCQLAESGGWVDITQGLDARLLTDSNIALLNRIKLKGLHFAWDNPRDDGIKENFKKFISRTAMTKHRKPCVYLLTNYWSSHEEDLSRVYWLRDNGFDPYVMVYDKYHAPQETRYLQRWVNNRKVFGKIKRFEDFDHRQG